MERLAGDLLSPIAIRSDRLRLLQWTLFGLVRRLDEEGAYGSGWIDRTANEIRNWAQRESVSKLEEQVRRHVETIKP